jgi:hypothetical protein
MSKISDNDYLVFNWETGNQLPGIADRYGMLADTWRTKTSRTEVYAIPGSTPGINEPGLWFNVWPDEVEFLIEAGEVVHRVYLVEDKPKPVKPKPKKIHLTPSELSNILDMADSAAHNINQDEYEAAKLNIKEILDLLKVKGVK